MVSCEEHVLAIFLSEERRETFQVAVNEAVVRIWNALQWHLSPQWSGMPHVQLGRPSCFLILVLVMFLRGTGVLFGASNGSNGSSGWVHMNVVVSI